MPTAATLLGQAKLILHGEVQDLAEDVAHAKSELLEVRAWLEEVRSLLQNAHEESELFALQTDVDDLAVYEADLKRPARKPLQLQASPFTLPRIHNFGFGLRMMVR